MSRLLPIFVFGTLLLTVGCTPPWSNVVNPPNRGQGRYISETPTAAQLVSQLNATSQRLRSLECRDVDIQAKQGHQTIDVLGIMMCQQPRDFRITAKVVGQPALDIGSNSQEFWFWLSKAEPPGLYYCSYADLSRGGIRLPFPFQPAWVMEALGMADRDPNGSFEPVKATRDTFELIERTTGPQGQPIRKVTVFSRTQSLVVLGHRLEDARGLEICSAQILERTSDRANQVVVPQKVQLNWRAADLTMKLKLGDIHVNPPIDQDRAQAAFRRPQLKNINSYDLAQTGQYNGIQRTGGPIR
jgi:hypothetical protein